MNTEEQIKEYLFNHEDVKIIHNDEIGEWLWSVEVVESYEFWMDSFKTKTEAYDYCRVNELKVVGEIDKEINMTKLDQYKELLSALLDCINDKDITYEGDQFGICYSAKLVLNIERAEKMIQYDEYDSVNDVYERVAKAIENLNQKHSKMFKKLAKDDDKNE